MNTALTHAVLFVVAGVLLAACSGADMPNLLEPLTGEKDTRLEGKRETIRLSTSSPNTPTAPSSEPVVTPIATPNTEWPQPGGNESNSLSNLALNTRLAEAFTVKAGAGAEEGGRITARPVVAGGRVFVLDSLASVRAFDMRSGALQWAVSTVPQGRSAAGVLGGGLATDGRRVYVTTMHGEVVALDAATGGLFWRTAVSDPVRSAPVVSQGKVVFVTAENTTVALSAETGAKVWERKGAGAAASVLVDSSPAVSGDTVVVTLTSGIVQAMSLASGSERWSKQPRGSRGAASNLSAASRPVIDGNRVIVLSSTGLLAAYDLATGGEIWAQKAGGVQTPWVSGEYVFATIGKGSATAVTRADGAVRWASELGGGAWTGPVMAGGQLWFGNTAGQLVSVSPQTGKRIQAFEVGEPVTLAPVVAGGMAFVLTSQGTLKAYR